MKVQAVGRTAVVMKRSHKEDNFLLEEGQSRFVVADGLRGQA